MWHKWEREEVLTRLWYGELRERDHLEDIGGGKIILKWMLKKQVVRTWTDLSCKRKGKRWAFVITATKLHFTQLQKMLAAEETLCCVQLICQLMKLC
jgi:hypothetical protein